MYLILLLKLMRHVQRLVTNSVTHKIKISVAGTTGKSVGQTVAIGSIFLSFHFLVRCSKKWKWKGIFQKYVLSFHKWVPTEMTF